MKKYLVATFTIVSCFMMNGCASSFKSIDPRGANYSNKLLDDNIEFSYQYDILRALPLGHNLFSEQPPVEDLLETA